MTSSAARNVADYGFASPSNSSESGSIGHDEPNHEALSPMYSSNSGSSGREVLRYGASSPSNSTDTASSHSPDFFLRPLPDVSENLTDNPGSDNIMAPGVLNAHHNELAQSPRDSFSSPDFPSENQQLFATPTIQLFTNYLLKHLEQWWDESEKLLKIMASNKISCDRIMKMSDKIDSMLEESIMGMIRELSTDPAAFPVASLVSATRKIKRSVLYKTGLVCCKNNHQDECAAAASAALKALKRFRNSATNLYDELLRAILMSLNETPASASDFTENDFDADLNVLFSDPSEKGSSIPTSRGPSDNEYITTPAMKRARR